MKARIAVIRSLSAIVALGMAYMPVSVVGSQLTPQLVLSLRAVSDVALSPDGREVLFRRDRERTPQEPLGAEVGELDRLAGSARQYFPAKKAQVARGRGFVGIEVEDGPGGIRVKRVLPGSPAAKAGIQAGDLIVRASLGGPAETVDKADQLVDLASSLAGGGRIFLALKRAERPYKVTVAAERASM